MMLRALGLGRRVLGQPIPRPAQGAPTLCAVHQDDARVHMSTWLRRLAGPKERVHTSGKSQPEGYMKP